MMEKHGGLYKHLYISRAQLFKSRLALTSGLVSNLTKADFICKFGINKFFSLGKAEEYFIRTVF